MNGFWGADTEAVRAQGEACTGAAGTMETLLRSCSSLVSAADWSGEDAEAFRERWVSEVDSRLQQVIEMLRADGEALRRHGDEQDEASSDDGGLGTGAPGAPIPTLPGFPSVPIPTLPGLPSLPGLSGIRSLPSLPLLLPDVPLPDLELPDIDLPEPSEIWGPISAPVPAFPLPGPLPAPVPLPELRPLPLPQPAPWPMSPEWPLPQPLPQPLPLPSPPPGLESLP